MDMSIGSQNIESVIGVSPQALSSINEQLESFELWISKKPIKYGTRRVYCSRLRHFRVFVQQQTSQGFMPNYRTNSFNQLIRSFVTYAQKQDLSLHTVNNFLSLFRQFADYSSLPMEEVSLIGFREPKEKCLLTEQELQVCVKVARDGKSKRDLALVLLFLKTDLRLGECRDLRISDFVRTANGVMMQLVRGGRTKFEKVDRILHVALVQWLDERAKVPCYRNSTYLFPGMTGKKISTNALDATIRRIGIDSGLTMSCRRLRDTAHGLPAEIIHTACLDLPTDYNSAGAI
ncbi:MAG: site-specific integrase [Candidatus Obscuribacterales bacterium]|nr:site-specific integrase [Candidatus Obscuribacterales bacterium]